MIALPALLLALACTPDDAAEAPTVAVDVDGVDGVADVSFDGDADRLRVTVVPRDMEIGGEALGAVAWDLDLAGWGRTKSYSGDDLVVAVEGELVDATFEVGGVTYALDPAPVEGSVVLGPAPFHADGDADERTVGTAEGELNVYEADDEGFDAIPDLRVTFSEGGPDGDEHAIDVDEVQHRF